MSGGFRYLRLKERDYHPQDITKTFRLKRREFLLHVGMQLQIRENLSFWPALYFEVIDNRESFISNPTLGERDEDEIEAKVNLPLNWRFLPPERLPEVRNRSPGKSHRRSRSPATRFWGPCGNRPPRITA